VPPPVKAEDPIAVLADHLGRLLAQADKLLAEWQAHADALKPRFDAEARAAGETLKKTLEGTLAEVAQASATELRRALGANAQALVDDVAKARKVTEELATRLGGVPRGGGSSAPASRGPVVPLLLLANALLIGLIALIAYGILRSSGAPPHGDDGHAAHLGRSGFTPPPPQPAALPDAGMIVIPKEKPPCATIVGSTAHEVLEKCATDLGMKIDIDTKKLGCDKPPENGISIAWLMSCLPRK
jgi:hypothetical protein